jgi:hypothetical protein
VRFYLRYPYKPVNKKSGLGFEDWSWNIETIRKNIPHLVVPETVHLIQIKESGSLGQQSALAGLFSTLPEEVWPNLGY